jgi:hypothetical protein
MKRWFLVSCVIFISVLGVLAPAAAQASTVAGGKLTSGKPVSVTISKSGQQIRYTFAATANQNVTFDVTKFKLKDDGSTGAVYLAFYEPDSSAVYQEPSFGSDGYYNFTPPESGTWSAVLVPIDASVGSLTLTFANDVPTQALTSGKPVTTTIKYAGQEAGYTFTATANKNVTFDVTNFDFTNDGSTGAVYLAFYEPHSSTVYQEPSFGSDGSYKLTPPESGTWSIALVPIDASVGSLTIELK